MSRVYKQQKIPFPTSDKRYGRVWARMKKGDTLEQALADLDKPRKPGKLPGVLKPEKPAETPDTKPPEEKRSPDSEQPKAPENAGNKEPWCPPPSVLFKMPPELKHLERLEELARLPALEKYFDKITVHLATMSRNIERIADHLDPKPGQVIEVDTSRLPVYDQSTRPIPIIERTAGEFREGDKVLMVRGNPHKAFGVGKIVRILPGKEQIKVQFTEEVKIAPWDHFQLFKGGS
jgi:hypothetical protein